MAAVRRGGGFAGGATAPGVFPATLVAPLRDGPLVAPLMEGRARRGVVFQSGMARLEPCEHFRRQARNEHASGTRQDAAGDDVELFPGLSFAVHHFGIALAGFPAMIQAGEAQVFFGRAGRTQGRAQRREQARLAFSGSFETAEVFGKITIHRVDSGGEAGGIGRFKIIVKSVFGDSTF